MDEKTMERTFCVEVERERVRLGLSQAEFAKRLGLTLNRYKRAMTGEVSKLELIGIYRLYKVTGKLLFEYYGYSDDYCNTVANLRRLNNDQLRVINVMIDALADKN